MTNVHIYTAGMQPATSYVDNCGDIEIKGGFTPNKLIYTRCCNKKRMAKDCVVQCYYDGMSVWCAPGCGCKSEFEIEAKRKKEFDNRSAGQKKRYAKVA